MLVHLRPEAIIAIVGVIVTIAVALPQLIPAATKGINTIRSWNRPHILPLYAPSPEVAANSAANLATELYSVLVSVPARVKTRVGEGLQAGFRVMRDPLAQCSDVFGPLSRWNWSDVNHGSSQRPPWNTPPAASPPRPDPMDPLRPIPGPPPAGPQSIECIKNTRFLTHNRASKRRR